MTPRLVIESILRVMLLGAGVWALVYAVRLRSATRERTIWLGVVGAALLMPVAVALRGTAFRQPAAGVARPAWVGDALAAADRVTSSDHAAAAFFRDLTSVLWPIYLGVALLLLVRLGLGLVLIRRLWRSATPVPALSTLGAPVRMAPGIDAPVVTARGILLPACWATWTPDTLRCVLAHERSHHAHHDFHWQVLARVHVALFWVSPFAWWLRRRIAMLAEFVSDEAVLAEHCTRTEYAALLLLFANGHRSALPTVGMARRSCLSHRIERILSASPRRAASRQSAAMIVCACAAIGTTSALNPWLRLAPAQRSAVTDGRRVGTAMKLGSVDTVATPITPAPPPSRDLRLVTTAATHFGQPRGAAHAHMARLSPLAPLSDTLLPLAPLSDTLLPLAPLSDTLLPLVPLSDTLLPLVPLATPDTRR